ncbi:MAG: hypothetical protein AUI93_05060 [Crenarchaeota archaeon 13_1_40CM_3_52_10]|nr:MAG: hypothetical protein AUI93_05060 [Crenarchaeota archaeon 13_1_40CM_3_52_10]
MYEVRQAGIPADSALRNEVAGRVSVMWWLVYHGHCDGEEAQGRSLRSKSAHYLGLESREMDSCEEKLVL